jgi:hypothetical protein
MRFKNDRILNVIVVLMVIIKQRIIVHSAINKKAYTIAGG